MAISKRELALSQELMDLDRVYNELNRRYNLLNIENNANGVKVKTLLDLITNLEAKLTKSEEKVIVLKSTAKKVVASKAK